MKGELTQSRRRCCRRYPTSLRCCRRACKRRNTRVGVYRRLTVFGVRLDLFVASE